jgi:hypothetical protein
MNKNSSLANHVTEILQTPLSVPKLDVPVVENGVQGDSSQISVSEVSINDHEEVDGYLPTLAEEFDDDIEEAEISMDLIEQPSLFTCMVNLLGGVVTPATKRFVAASSNVLPLSSSNPESQSPLSTFVLEMKLQLDAFFVRLQLL